MAGIVWSSAHRDCVTCHQRSADIVGCIYHRDRLCGLVSGMCACRTQIEAGLIQKVKSMQPACHLNLIEAACAGDTEAIERLLLEYQPSIVRFARKYCATPEDVEDAVQETL